MAKKSYFVTKIFLDENFSIPLEIETFYNETGNQKAVVKLIYAGMVINDVYVIQKGRHGTLSVVFPQKTLGKANNTKMVSTVFPGVPNLSKQFNNAILSAYFSGLSIKN